MISALCFPCSIRVRVLHLGQLQVADLTLELAILRLELLVLDLRRLLLCLLLLIHRLPAWSVLFRTAGFFLRSLKLLVG